VRAANPRIVYCSLSGYGQVGPYRDRPGHDLDYLAISGLLTLLGPAGARPIPPGLQIADLAGGTLAALEIVAALLRRERTGDGATLDVAILDAVVAWLGPLGAGLSTAGSGPGPLSGAYPCYGVYAAGDGAFLAVGALEPPFWVAFCRGIGREDLVPRQYDPTAMPEVAAVLATRPRAEWLGLLGDDACVAPVNAPREAELDPQIQARGLVVGKGSAARVRSPLGVEGLADHVPPPGLGEHTLEVLAAAGFAPDEVAGLARDRVITGPATPEATARAERLASVLARLAERDRT
jgi:crotonobetainyl-CoA:carnitine CoA-transferase CaiB-like acyl-CoA transferase